MEVVEVNDDFPCHPDGEEVVLLDLDKANGPESPEIQEVTVTVEDDNANGIDVVIETCEGNLVVDDAVADDAVADDAVADDAVADDAVADDAVADDAVAEETQAAADGGDAGACPVVNVKLEDAETMVVDDNPDSTMTLLTDQTAGVESMDVVTEVEGPIIIKIEERLEIQDSQVVQQPLEVMEIQEMDESANIGIDDNTPVEIENFVLENSVYENSLDEISVNENSSNENPLSENLSDENPSNENPSNEDPSNENSSNESPSNENPSNENSVNDNSVSENSVIETQKNADGSLVLKKDKITVTIPQHIAGRDISSLTEETLPRTGKRMLKPRYGVKVPYIHMTSQIVTQDEIAKELFERFQQKYPITRVENKSDKLFSMKLTNRLANKISPSKNPDGKTKIVSKTPDKSSKKLSNTNKELLKKKSDKIDKGKSTNDKSVVNNSNKTEGSNNQLSNNVSKESIDVNDSQHIDQITNTLQSLDQSDDQHINNVSEDKNVEKITSNEELIAILEDFENIETADTNSNQVPETPKPVIKKKIVRSTTRTKRSKPKLDPEIEKQIALKQLQEVSRPKRFDSHFAKRKAENEKKLLPKTDLGSAQKRKKPSPDDVPEVKIAIDHYIKSYTDKRQSTIKVESTSNDETINDNNEEVDEPEIKTNNVAKARTMREINRLLGDEGAINMIYSLEKRRSPGNNNSKNILPSTRRKKKDLMLKTKLVKNAMLKMSSPTCQSLSTNRLGRRSDVCSPSISPENKCTRKMSIDSQGSDQSMKCLGNFPGRKAIPADESKIIRKHSSSSEASSVGGSPILPIPDSIPINNLTEKHIPVKALRVYTRKNKNSDDQLLNTSDQSLNVVSKGTNKNITKTKNSTAQKVKKQEPVQVSSKLSRSLAESIKQEVDETTYDEITIRRYDGVVHITLTPVSTAMKNALNISVMEELMKELNNLENDDTCKVVLVSSAGRIFCQGLDIAPLIHDDPDKCKEAAVKIASTLKKFITCISDFPKLLVAGVDGAAVGLGATMLVHFDLVFASDKATFETPYAQLGHIAEGAATTILGRLLVAEMIMGSQRLTAGQAHYYGLVTRTLWPDRFHDELIPLVKSLARQSLQAMKTSKALQKQETKEKLAKALETETHILVQQWTGDECQQNLQAYLKDAVDNIIT